MKKVIVAGGGIIGIAIARALAARGAAVTLLDAGLPGATAASFGWINDSFFLTPAHQLLRAEGVAAWRELATRMELPLDWCGSLAWDVQGSALERQYHAARDAGMAVEWIDARRFGELEPEVATPPDAALLYPHEAVAEPGLLAAALKACAVSRGVQIINGVTVTGFTTRGEVVRGVRTTAGEMCADEVVLAAGTGTMALSETLGHALPMVGRPALTLLSQPVARLTRRVLVTPIGDIRQLPDGALAMPAAVNHQSSEARAIDPPEATAEAAMARLGTLFGRDIRWQQAALAYRPMPQDGLPVLGRLREGLYVSVMHSGITLAAIAGELGAAEVLDGPSNRSADLLASFRPERFG